VCSFKKIKLNIRVEQTDAEVLIRLSRRQFNATAFSIESIEISVFLSHVTVFLAVTCRSWLQTCCHLVLCRCFASSTPFSSFVDFACNQLTMAQMHRPAQQMPQTHAHITHQCSLEIIIVQVAQKSKPLPNYQKMVLNRVEACQW